MTLIPSDIPAGTVTGQFYFVNEDNVDTNTDPTLTVVSGSVTFTGLVARACSGDGSENAPLTRCPVLVGLGSDTLSSASPAVEITFAVVDAE